MPAEHVCKTIRDPCLMLYNKGKFIKKVYPLAMMTGYLVLFMDMPKSGAICMKMISR